MASECVDLGSEMEADASLGQLLLCQLKLDAFSVILEAAAVLMGIVANLGLEAVIQQSDIRNEICEFYSAGYEKNAFSITKS